ENQSLAVRAPERSLVVGRQPIHFEAEEVAPSGSAFLVGMEPSLYFLGVIGGSGADDQDQTRRQILVNAQAQDQAIHLLSPQTCPLFDSLPGNAQGTKA